MLKGDDAVAADTVAKQLSLDPRREARLVMEEAADRGAQSGSAGVAFVDARVLSR
ncbi:hypothetical protein PV343_02905 [Streptomyces sp. WI03-4A]|uniref:hypothetical protein n=1 Tax=Streptomyces sp. WI03-4A TaxID=3028706 RepID=UPI0029B8EB82|nr:hypothetical protein [Streptomyces sp. WI03-4A]MDX2591272.1 hypothetical protein [Streptomyces sp. WI03-4A]